MLVSLEVSSSRNLRNIDLQAFNKDFHTSLNSEVTGSENNVNCVINDFEKALTVTLDKHVTVTKKTCSNRVRQTCYNHEIHEARRVRHKLQKKWRKTGLENHHQLYLAQLDLVNNMIENAKKFI